MRRTIEKYINILLRVLRAAYPQRDSIILYSLKIDLHFLKMWVHGSSQRGLVGLNDTVTP